MKITLTLPDQVADAYSAYLRETQTLEQILALQLERYQAVDPRWRLLIVMPEERSRLEALLGRLPLTTVPDMIERVSRLAEVSIGRIRFRFTPTQFRMLKEYADKWRMPVRDYAEQVVRQIEDAFFETFPAPRQAAPPAPGDEILLPEPAAPAPGAPEAQEVVHDPVPVAAAAPAPDPGAPRLPSRRPPVAPPWMRK